MRLNIVPKFFCETMIAQGLVENLISIYDPGEDPPIGYDSVPNKLRLEFHDVCVDREDFVAPTKDHVLEALRFAKDTESLVIHCAAGISRSPGIALAVICQLHEQLNIHDPIGCIDYLFFIAPHSIPNAKIVSIVDEMFGYGGELYEALNLKRKNVLSNQPTA